MIYFVTKNKELFDNEVYSIIDVDKCLQLLWSMPIIQFDSETNGRDAHINKLLCIQFGNDSIDCRIVVDTSTISVLLFKEVLENKCLILQNAKFDLQFLYNYGICPLKIYDTMIVEQFLYLGYSSGLTVSPQEYDDEGYNFPYHINDKGTYTLSFALDAIAKKRLGIYIDKQIRGQIIYRGLDTEVIKYAANDVVYLEKIMQSQLKDLRKIPNALKGAKIECDFTPVIAYLEWCGIKLDEDKWLKKMKKDRDNLSKSEEALNTFIVDKYLKGNDALKEFISINNQLSLFEEDNKDVGKPKASINWSSSPQVVKVAKALGFNTSTKDKKTGLDKDSAMEKQLKGQKGINDEFLKLYFGKGNIEDEDYFPGYSGSFKVVTSFGQGHLNAINPITGRIHTTYKALGALSGRMSCGSNQNNTDLAKLKHINPKDCTYVNIQQLPADEDTRSAFIAEKCNMMVDCDFSALESRLGADIYQEKSMINEFLYGSGDMHSLCAKMVFHEELKDVDVKDIKKKRPDLRKKVKPIEFSQQFGGSEFAIASSLGCSLEEAKSFKVAYDTGFKGISKFKEVGSRFVKEHGYVEICKDTGHRMYWWDWKHWKKVHQSFDNNFWEDYKLNHKGNNDDVCKKVKEHFQASSKWDKMALNGPTQGCGAIILKTAATNLYHWIIDNNLFGKVKICALVHDEILAEYPKELDNFPKILEDTMFKAAAIYCKSVPIPAEAEVSNHWVH